MDKLEGGGGTLTKKIKKTGRKKKMGWFVIHLPDPQFCVLQLLKKILALFLRNVLQQSGAVIDSQ